MPTSISIVEDNDKLRATLAKVIDRAEGFHCVSHYPSAEAALVNLPVVKPDVVLMDINLRTHSTPLMPGRLMSMSTTSGFTTGRFCSAASALG